MIGRYKILEDYIKPQWIDHDGSRNTCTERPITDTNVVKRSSHTISRHRSVGDQILTKLSDARGGGGGGDFNVSVRECDLRAFTS